MSEYHTEREARRISVNLPLKLTSDKTSEDIPFSENLNQKDIDNVLSQLDNITRQVQKIKDLLEQSIKTPLVSGRVINLSGKGLLFLSKTFQEPGESIKMQFTLPIEGNVHISLLSKVIWTRKCDREKRFEIAVKFVELSQEDETTIIKYTFAKEREELQERKREKENR